MDKFVWISVWALAKGCVQLSPVLVAQNCDPTALIEATEAAAAAGRAGAALDVACQHAILGNLARKHLAAVSARVLGWNPVSWLRYDWVSILSTEVLNEI